MSVFAFAMALYFLTLAPTVTLVDSGELIVAAATLGVAHPPGFPLYVLLAHLASIVPMGSVALRVNFASAVFGALAAAAATLAILELSFTVFSDARGRAGSRNRKGRAGAVSPANPQAAGPAWMFWAPALAAGLVLCASRTLWAYATIAEVYTLNTFLIALILFFMLRWRRRILELRDAPGSPGPAAPAGPDRWLNGAALVFGLALGVHHVTVGLMLPAFAVLVLATEGPGFFTGRRLAAAAAWACAGLAVYVYLPLAAARAPVMNWGDPRTPGRFWAHITGSQYQVFFDLQPGLMGRQFLDFLARSAREFGPWWLPLVPALAAAGFVYMRRHARGVFWFLVTAVLANLLYNANYEIAEDKDAYYLPVFLVVAIAAAFGVRFLIETVRTGSGRRVRLQRIVAAFCLTAVPAVALASNYGYDNRRNYTIAQDYVGNLLAAVQPGGMLLTLDWQVYSPMFYRREIEGLRPDVVLIDINQLRRSWYFDYLERAYPRTIEEARPQVDAFLEDLRHWERDPSLYERDTALNRRISDRFRDLILALAANHARSAPVYVTQEIATYPAGGPDSDWAGLLASDYQLVPEGLVFRLFSDRRFHEPEQPALVTRGLVDGTLHFAADDVVKVKVLPVYVGMAYNRGRYLAAANHHEEALRAFEQALALDPGYVPALQAAARSRAALLGAR